MCKLKKPVTRIACTHRIPKRLGFAVLIAGGLFATAELSHRTGFERGRSAGWNAYRTAAPARDKQVLLSDFLREYVRHYPQLVELTYVVMCMGEVTAGECAHRDLNRDGYVTQEDLQERLRRALDPRSFEAWVKIADPEAFEAVGRNESAVMNTIHR